MPGKVLHYSLFLTLLLGTEVCVRAQNDSTTTPSPPTMTSSRCKHGEIRLRDGANNGEGRVEVCVKENWGTVCSDKWSDADAATVCWQWGYSRFGATAVKAADNFVVGTSGPVHLDDVACSGDEYRLIDCPRGLQAANCGHEDDAGVICSKRRCKSFEMRLFGGSTEFEGGLEICLDEHWLTLSSMLTAAADLDKPETANKVCHKLGFSGIGGTFVKDPASLFGEAPTPIVDVSDCRTEFVPDSCENITELTVDAMYAGLLCQPRICEDGDLRLTSDLPNLPFAGRVDVCYLEKWGLICDSSWTMNEAGVVCGQLGFPREGAVAFPLMYHIDELARNVFLEDVICTGGEQRITSCKHTWTTKDYTVCPINDLAAVQCPRPLCNDGDVRLADGATQFEGRVEMCQRGKFGTICDDGWGDNEARVFCKSLGKSGRFATPLPAATFGEGSGPILLSDMACMGTENSIAECPANHLSKCTHAEDASVRCQKKVCEEGSVRVNGGPTKMEGWVEVCHDEIWQGVCDSGWNDQQARVVCRQLGFSTEGAQGYIGSFYGEPPGPLIGQYFCEGCELKLSHCDLKTVLCEYSKTAAVRCSQ